MRQNASIGTKLSAQYKPNDPKMNLLDIDPRCGTRAGHYARSLNSGVACYETR